MATINGTAGNDVLTGTAADDTILGLAGDDRITDAGGNDTIDGGAGNDWIYLERDWLLGYGETVSVMGGAGNDYVALFGQDDYFTVDLGDGDDTVFVGSVGLLQLTLGTGVDRIIFADLPYRFTVTDFVAGNAGDVIDLADAVTLWAGGGGNPFASQFLALVQNGADVDLQFSYGGGGTGLFTILTLPNVTLGSLTAHNFAGFDPLGGPLPAGATIVGTVGADSLVGTAGADVLFGGDGNDTLVGRFGNDALDGGLGDDLLQGSGGTDTIHGGDGADTIEGGAQDDLLYGEAGDDLLKDRDGSDTLDGGSGNDRLEASGSGGTLIGGDGNDVILHTGYGSSNILGGLGNDSITVDHGQPPLWANNYRGPDSHVIDAGDGDDTVVFRSQWNASIDINLGAGNDRLDYAMGFYSGPVTLGSGTDTVKVTTLNAFYHGPLVIADFAAAAGGDVVDLFATLDGIPFVWDRISNPFAGGFVSLDQTGNDVALMFHPDPVIWPNDFRPLIVFQNTTVAQFTAYNFGGLAPDGSAIVGVNLTGTAGDDVLTGTLAADTLSGLGGNDTLEGGSSDDTLDGGDGNDVLNGGLGSDTLLGGAGDDTITGSIGNDVIRGGAGADHITDGGLNIDIRGEGDNDTITVADGTGIVDGGDGDDTLDVNFGAYQVDHDDRLYAGAGNDTVRFGIGANYDDVQNALIDLGAGNDVLTMVGSPASRPVITLGTGTDRIELAATWSSGFRFDGSRNWIEVTDFVAGDGGDTIDISAFVRQYGEGATASTNPFEGEAYTRLVQDGADTRLEWCSWGDGETYYTIAVFRGVSAASFTDYNFGYDLDAPLPPGVTLTGTTGDDVLTGTIRLDALTGLAGNDTLYGGGRADLLDGGSDNDTLYGGGGADTVRGGSGNDTLVGGSGADIVEGGDGDDTIQASDSLDAIDGGAGFDTVAYTSGYYGNDGIDIDLSTFQATKSYTQSGRTVVNVEAVAGIDGTNGTDRIIYGAAWNTPFNFSGWGGNDRFVAGSGDDRLQGDDGDDWLEGLAGNDTLAGHKGNDTMLAGAGHDRITDLSGTDTVDGGDGDDDITLLLSAGDVIIGGAGFDSFTLGWDMAATALDVDFTGMASGQGLVGGAAFSISGIEAINITFNPYDGDDRILFAATWTQHMQLAGGLGNDQITSGSGDDVLDGGAGDDVLIGNDGNDVLYSLLGNDRLDGGAGNDGFDLALNVGDSVAGGAGYDVINVRAAGLDTPVDIDFRQLAGGSLIVGGTAVAVTGVERVLIQLASSWSSDRLIFDDSYSFDLQASLDLGDDQVTGGAGNDDFTGGWGDDVLRGGAGNDRLWGDSMGMAAGNDVLDGGAGDDFITGGGGGDTLTGGSGADEIRGETGDDMIDAGEGNDYIYAGAGADTIRAGAGDDVIYYRPGDGMKTLIDGGTGYDTLDISTYQMHFAWHFDKMTGIEKLRGGDTFVDLTSGNDLLDLAAFEIEGRVTFLAGAGNDTVSGNAQANWLRGEAGDDQLIGLAGGDELLGGDGNDVLSGGADNDTLDGGSGDDLLLVGGEAGLDLYLGGAGTDELRATQANTQVLFSGTNLNPAGSNWVDIEKLSDGGFGGMTVGGASTNDQFDLNAYLISGAIVFDLGAGDDSLSGDSQGNILRGGDGNDSISGNGGHDVIRGGNGNDTLDGGTGDDLFEYAGQDGFDAQVAGGSGFDTIAAIADASVFWSGTSFSGIELVSGAGYLLTVVGDNADQTFDLAGASFTTAGSVVFDLGGGNDLFLGNAQDNVARGDFGDDRLEGGSGSDQLDGGYGQDQLLGGEGNDLLLGGEGGDELLGGAGNDTMLGGFGDDTYYAESQADLAIEVSGGGFDRVISTGSYYLYAEVENLTLQAGSGDLFGVGNELNNQIAGNEGANLLIGGGGSDQLDGNAGNDLLFGQTGADTLNGGAGIDYLVGGSEDDTVDGGDGADALYGEDGNDILTGGLSFDTDILVGGAGDDLLDGWSGQGNPDYDLLNGGDGDDIYIVDTGADLTFEAIGGGDDVVIADIRVPGAGVYLYANVEALILVGTTAFGVGNELDNVLLGSDTANWLLGGAGDDLIEGGLGNDVLFGEAGADVFAFASGTGGDVIGDFQIGQDLIGIAGIFADFAEAKAHFVQNGTIGAIDLGGGDVIVLHGVTMSQLTANDFIFA